MRTGLYEAGNSSTVTRGNVIARRNIGDVKVAGYDSAFLPWSYGDPILLIFASYVDDIVGA